jgi:hypothetical protein
MANLSRIAVNFPVSFSRPAARPVANYQTCLHQLTSNPSLRQISPIIPAISNSYSTRTVSISEQCRDRTSKRAQYRLASIQHRAFSRSTALARDHYFDTLKFVQLLKDEGFTEDQAVAMMKVLGDVIEER